MKSFYYYKNNRMFIDIIIQNNADYYTEISLRQTFCKAILLNDGTQRKLLDQFRNLL